MTVQIAVKLPDDLVTRIDELVQRGHFRNRSEAVREALTLLARTSRDRALDQAFVDGFEAFPEQPEELADAHRLAVETISAEPWEKWW